MYIYIYTNASIAYIHIMYIICIYRYVYVCVYIYICVNTWHPGTGSPEHPQLGGQHAASPWGFACTLMALVVAFGVGDLGV